LFQIFILNIFLGLDKEHFAAPIIERMIRSEPSQRIQLKEIIAILGSQQ